MKCPTCSKKDFDRKSDVKRHHAQSHGESIAYESRVCERCGNNFRCRTSSEQKFCSRTCSNRATKLTGEDNPAKRDEVRKKISENTLYGDNLSEAGRKAIENANNPTGKDHPFYNVTGSDHPCSFPSGGPPKADQIEVTQTGHTVRSHWEKEVDILLHSSDLSYDYEPKSFELDWTSYCPDFIVEESIVIEVKGYISERCVWRAKHFKEEYDKFYLVVGNRLPADAHLPWEYSSRLPQVLKFAVQIAENRHVQL